MYFELLKEWCDALLNLQVREIKRKEIYGGIMCPSCARIHGRCGDTIYPLMFMTSKTGEVKYMEAAKLLFDWTENMVRPDGSYNNDTNSDWKGITVFAAIQLGEALYYHSDLLDSVTRQRWLRRFRISVDYLHDNIERIGGNINYPVTCAAAMSIAYKLLRLEKYAIKAKKLAKEALHYFTEDGLLYGEGKPQDGTTAKGCRPVDLGYNVEESLPGLITYALYMEDEEVLNIAAKSMETHLSFMLSDGAWDNSWGTRNNKWSYWGSRTSDGCQAGYGLLAEHNPIFAEAVYRNTLLLKECTHEGLLHGGPMYHSAGEPPCVHHTFCHAKAIAIMLEHGICPKSSVMLPRETALGVTHFPSIHVSLAAKEEWRMTISDYDFEYSEEGHATGGAITLLWNKRFGPICVGTMGKYYLVEPNNMQLPMYTKDICLTPRIETCTGETYYRNINDKAARVEYQDEDNITFHTKGKLVDGKQNGTDPFDLEYIMTEDAVELRGSVDAEHAVFYLPIISASTDTVKQDSENCYIVTSARGELILKADHPIRVKGGFDKKIPLDQEEAVAQDITRVFNPVSGFEAVVFYLKLETGKKFRLKIQIKPAALSY
ncbi:MAG: hypothetical protein K0R46_1237 [Herbinix sp.]|nr:hypothetical protein [Herbinix sp.]